MRQMAFVFYYLRRAVAIALGGTLTGYSAWCSWHHSYDVLGPLAAVSAAVLLALSEHAWRDRQVIRLVLLGVLGITAAVISGTVVLERVTASQAARLSASRTDNLPKVEAQKALTEAKKALEKAEADASAECKSGEGPRCTSLTKRETEARNRVNVERSKLVGLGATSVENPVASVLGDWTALYHRAMPLALPLWLELAAPVVLAYGFAPGRRKAPESKSKDNRRQKKRGSPRKPAAQDGVADWCAAYRQKHGCDPKVADVTKAFKVSRTTAWRRIRGAG
jgi:hypothetical protein